MFSLQRDCGCHFSKMAETFETLEKAKSFAKDFLRENPYDAEAIWIYDGDEFTGVMHRYPSMDRDQWEPRNHDPFRHVTC